MKSYCDGTGDADVVVAHLAEAAEIPIRLPEPVSAAATRAQARDPDAVCMRGAVWGPQATEGDAMASSAFVSVRSLTLRAVPISLSLCRQIL